MKWALVTGAARRLGRATALELGRAGWGVVLHYRSEQAEAESALAEIAAAGGAGAIVQGELTASGAPEAIMQAANGAAGGNLRALVNCAAVFEHDVPAAIDAAMFDRQMHVNALAPALLASAFAKTLPESERGAIVNFLDFKIASPYPDHFSYSMSKFALAGAVELLARGLAPRIRVNAVAPGYVLPSPGQSEERFKELHAAVTPLKYGATPADIAGAVRYLLEAEAVTGQTIFVDSGLRFLSFERDFTFQ
ncbi:MAG: SDR family oxidoreductase [Hyphomonadaceae bacterium]|nr:SDR family oxidoreductase [Hyphomonadaceae bacterium]